MAKAVAFPATRYDPHLTDRSAIIFETSDVDRFAQRLRRRRIPLLAGPTDRTEWGIRTVHLRDPDGNLIEVYCEHSRRS